MPEENTPEVKEEQEKPSDQVDPKTEQSFNLIRSHEEWMKRTQDFLDSNLNFLGNVEIERRVASYKSKKVLDLFAKWNENSASIDLTDPEDKRIYSDILLYVKVKNPDLVDVTLENMQKSFQELKQKEWEKKYKTTSRDFRNKNPLSLKIPGKQYKHDGAYVVYPSFHDGWAASYRMIENWRNWKSGVYKPNYSLVRVNAKYAANPGWASEVAMNLQVPITTQIWDIPTDKLVAAISAVEDGECYKLWVDEWYIPSLPWVEKRMNLKRKNVKRGK